jgi:cation diffusion facilitator family transporter
MARDDPAHESRLTVLVALAANAVIFLAKAIAGVLTGSAAMLAEAAHSLADTADQVALLVSIRLGRRPPDEEHQFGHGKERFFWAFVAAVWIFVAGAAFSIVRGVSELGSAGHVRDPGVALAVLGLAFAAECVSLVRATRQVRRGAAVSRRSLRCFLRDLRDPLPRVVLFEDGAAVIGIALAAAGLALSSATDNPLYDALASIAIGLLLAGVAIAIGAHARDLLLGQSASPGVHDALAREAERAGQVRSVQHLMTMHIGPDDLLVAGDIVVPAAMTIEQLQTVTEDVSRRLRDAEPSVQHVFLRPVPSGPG